MDGGDLGKAAWATAGLFTCNPRTTDRPRVRIAILFWALGFAWAIGSALPETVATPARTALGLAGIVLPISVLLWDRRYWRDRVRRNGEL